jgi:hypothetical protein
MNNIIGIVNNMLLFLAAKEKEIFENSQNSETNE